MHRRTRVAFKPPVTVAARSVIPVAASVVQVDPQIPVIPVISKPTSTPTLYSVTNKLPSKISNVSVRAGAGPVIKSVYENTYPVPNVHVQFIEPHIIDVTCAKLKEAAVIQLSPTDASSPAVEVKLQVSDKFCVQRVSIPWTIDLFPKTQLIPRIIHQTYMNRAMPAESYSACQTWWLTNPNYEYRFYDDTLSQTLMELWFAPDSLELKAYNMLYAGAYKSDIFRLALLYREGGVWADVSSVCEHPLDNYINANDEMIVCVDSPCQKRYANIHQAYIYVIPQHPAIQHILDYTVQTVVSRRFEIPGMVFQSIAVTGPTAFAEGLNDFLNRRPLEFFEPGKQVHLFKDDDISENPFRFTPFITESKIRFLDHQSGKIWINPQTIAVTTKFPKFSQFRQNVHYSILGTSGYIYKVPMTEFAFETGLQKLPIWQIWLQSAFVSRHMAAAMQTWQSDSYFQHCFVTEHTARLGTRHFMPEVWQAIDTLRPHAYKCDLLRALLLYEFGGLYVDADMVQIQSLLPIMDLYDVILLSSGPEQVDNGLMYFNAPGHPVLLHYLNRAVAQIKSRITVESDLALTGPRLWTSCVQEVFGWTTIPSEDSTAFGNVAVLLHEAITPNYAESPEVVSLELTGLPLQALQTVSPGTTVVTWNKSPYVCTKYPDYNKERIVMGGTNFAAEFQAGSVYHI